jgi:acyl-CoA synthetase (AMP-forming)/AMP-acid ligase II
MELKVIPISDAPVDTLESLPAGSVGELAVRGPVVTLGYAGLPEATRMARIVEPDGTVWHRMGDLGRIDDEGRVWLAGRRTERVETPDGVLYTDPLEGIANAIANRRTALVGVGQRPAQRPFLVVEGCKDAALAKQLAAALPQVQGILFKWKFPVDVRHNAKIHRLELATWAASRVPARALSGG